MKKYLSTFLVVFIIFTFLFTLGLTRAYSQDVEEDKVGDGALTETEELALEASDQLEGYNVLVTGRTGYGEQARIRIANLGATVTTVDPSGLTSDLLSQYDVLWIALTFADDVYNAGKKDVVLSFLNEGGGLILEQPSIAGDIRVLPYLFNISSTWYQGECVRNVLVPDHELVVGLPPSVLPACYDTVGEIGPEWEVLVRDGTGDPSLSTACYGAGKIIVELGNTSTYSCVCGICMDNVMIERMIKYAAVPCIPQGCDLTPVLKALDLVEAKLDDLGKLPYIVRDLFNEVMRLNKAVYMLETKLDVVQKELSIAKEERAAIESKLDNGEVVTQSDLADGQGGVWFPGAKKVMRGPTTTEPTTEPSTEP